MRAGAASSRNCRSMASSTTNIILKQSKSTWCARGESPSSCSLTLCLTGVCSARLFGIGRCKLQASTRRTYRWLLSPAATSLELLFICNELCKVGNIHLIVLRVPGWKYFTWPCSLPRTAVPRRGVGGLLKCQSLCLLQPFHLRLLLQKLLLLPTGGWLRAVH